MKDEPELGEFKFRVNNRWIDGTLNRAENPAFYGAGAGDTGRTRSHVHQIDEPPVLLGEDRGANPVEYLLTGLSGCVTTTFVAYAAAQGVKTDELRTELEGVLDVRGFLGVSGRVRPGYRQIRVRFHVKSDAPREKVEELIKLAERRSPVSDSVRKGVRVDFSLVMRRALDGLEVIGTGGAPGVLGWVARAAGEPPTERIGGSKNGRETDT
ncbi:MAG TPA: OsmC family protein [Candidatus Polarisedimenticolaceae bacterium]|nr:OsmC family protein [Candidatus Polarisedimenticolaceae bacterium]